MWPYDATVKFNVRATFKQSGAWGRAAGIKGLSVPVFLALAGDIYAEHIEKVLKRLERADSRRKARESR